MKEEHLRKILLFYFFVTLNEQRSKELARKSWLWCQRRKSTDSKADPDALVLLSLNLTWESLRQEMRTGVSRFSMDSGWILPQGISIESWFAFQKEAGEEELFVATLVGVLKYSIEEIENTLGLSTGTVRYRLAKATRRIGVLTSSNRAHS